MATPLDCPEIESWQTLLDDNIPPDQMGRLEQHLRSCAVCQDRLDWAPEGEAEFRRWAGRVGDPTAAPADPTLSQLLEQMHEGHALAAPLEPPDLYFLSPSGRPDILGTLGGYEVQEVIGQGGMGVVLKAYEPALHRLVAIKVLAAAVAGSATARRRFTREAKAAAAVCHDHIVAVHGVHEIDSLPYLVMQYVAGESLQERLDRTGPMEVEDVVRIGVQIASGLAAAHAQGLIHRDIKPANLLLETIADCRLRIADSEDVEESPDAQQSSLQSAIRNPKSAIGRVKITDFGLARMADDVQLTQAGVVAGTPEYMAPEQARGEPADHRSDVFSLGSVLYACCTGTAPFRGPTPLALLHAVNERAAAPLRSLNPAVPAWLESLIARLMAKDPEQRFQSAAEVAALLEGYLVHLRQPAISPAPILPPFVDDKVTRWPGDKVTENAHAASLTLSPRHLVTLSFFLLALLALLGGAAAFWLLGQGNQIQEIAQDGNAKQEANAKDALPDPYVVWSVAISPDGKVLAAGAGWWTTGGEVGVWDLATHKPLRRFVERRGVVSVAFSPDSKLLAFGSWTHHVRVLDWAAGKELSELTVEGLAHVAFSPDGAWLATASEGEDLQLWDVAKGELVANLEGDLLRFHRVTFSPDGKRLLACGGDWKKGGVNHAGVWDVATKKQVLKLTGHDNTVFCLACSPDGTTIATGSVDRTIRLYDAETGLLKGTLRTMREVDSLVFTSDSKTLLSSGPEPLVRFWDLEQGKETRHLDTGITHVRALSLTADDKTLVVGGQHKTLKIFNLETGKQVAVLWNGDDPQELDMDALPASTPEKPDETRSHPSIKLIVLALAMGALTIGLIAWTLARRRRSAGKTAEQPPAAEPAVEQKPEEVFFACSACGAKLKARGALVGKKVKCSRCAQAVSVPSIQAGESK